MGVTKLRFGGSWILWLLEKKKKNSSKKQFFQGSPRSSKRWRHQSYCNVPSVKTCGRPLAAVSVGAITHIRASHAQRPSLPREPSGYAGAWQPRSLFLLRCRCRCVTPRRYYAAIVHQLYCMQNSTVLCSMRRPVSWLPPISGTNVSTVLCQLNYLLIEHTALGLHQPAIDMRWVKWKWSPSTPLAPTVPEPTRNRFFLILVSSDGTHFYYIFDRSLWCQGTRYYYGT